VKSTKTFLTLKLLFPQGNIKLTIEQKKFICATCGFKNTSTLNSHIEKLVTIDWIWFDERTKNYNFRSIQSICKKLDLKINIGYEIELKDIQQFDAWLGGMIYGYCCFLFWKTFISSDKGSLSLSNLKRYLKIPQKGKGCVREKGSTNKVLSFSNLVEEPAPIALNGVQRLLGIDKSKLNRIKQNAIREKYIKVEHSYTITQIPTSLKNHFTKHIEVTGFLMIRNNKVIQINIDLINPTKMTRKRISKRKK
jgi:hypothetical protein